MIEEEIKKEDNMWIARLFNGRLFISSSKPILRDTYKGNVIVKDWRAFNDDEYFIDRKLFKKVTYENSPQKVELKLKTK
jgi:hypothetical protein